MSELGILQLIVSLLAATGAVGIYMKVGERLAVQEQSGHANEERLEKLEADLKEVGTLISRVNSFEVKCSQCERVVSDVRTSMGALTKIDVMSERIRANNERLIAIVEILKTIMPREEIDLRFRAQESELRTLKYEIDLLNKK